MHQSGVALFGLRLHASPTHLELLGETQLGQTPLSLPGLVARILTPRFLDPQRPHSDQILPWTGHHQRRPLTIPIHITRADLLRDDTGCESTPS